VLARTAESFHLLGRPARHSRGTTGEVVVLIKNKALYFRQSVDHLLINPNQIQHYGISVSNNPYDEVHDVGIDHEECFIPFETEGSTCSLIHLYHQMNN
jgi:hypothetical protein